jgi:hypothetical protein
MLNRPRTLPRISDGAWSWTTVWARLLNDSSKNHGSQCDSTAKPASAGEWRRWNIT